MTQLSHVERLIGGQIFSVSAHRLQAVALHAG
jgi:hypothetical protein